MRVDPDELGELAANILPISAEVLKATFQFLDGTTFQFDRGDNDEWLLSGVY